ncbi:hypothetical protein B0H13DRAFT_2322309 [Mycena leptocephala]|nr:hypothetical protein B0H13DRAFT_2322309 [Mycena leptocephala]
MSGVSEASLFLLQSAAPTSSMTYVIVGVLLCLTAWMAYLTSPMRLAAALVDALHETEEAHLWAIEAGVLSDLDVHTKMLSNLQMKVSIIREATLYNSLSSSQVLRELIKGHSFTLLQCIWEVQGLKTRIKILKERQLRQLNPLGTGVTAFRGSHIRSRRCCKCA